MPTKPLGVLVPGDPEYQYFYTKDVFCNEARKMFKKNIGVAVSMKFIEALRLRLLTNKYPSVNQVLSDLMSEFKGEQTLKNLKSTIRKSTYFDKDTGILNDAFHAEYFSRADEYLLNVVSKSNDMYEAPYVHEIVVTGAYTYLDITARIKDNPDMIFNIPAGTVGSTTLDFNSEHVQFVEIANYTPCVHLSHVFDYTYMCSKCRELEHYEYPMPAGSRCSKVECFGVLREDRTKRLKRSLYGTHTNFNQSLLPIISLVDLPLGSFTAAVVVRTSDDDKAHYLFIAGIVQKVYSSVPIVLEGKRHAVWEMCDLVDDIHKEKLGHQVRGLHYPKAAMIMTALSNLSGEPSHNVLMVGRSATGKSMVVKYYPHTILLRTGFFDGRTTSNAGLIGSSEPIKINGQVTKMYNPGALAHDQLVCIDELYSNPEMYKQLKTPLNQPEVTKKVSGTEFRIAKVGTVLATANINTAYLSSIRERCIRYAYEWDDADPKHARFRDCRGFYSQDVMDAFGWTNNRDKCIMELILKEELAAGRNYIDGEDISTLERYSFLFYIGEDGKEDKTACLPSRIDKKQKSYTSDDIRALAYTPGIEEYLRQRANADVDFPQELDPLLDEMCARLHSHNRIHTGQRQSKVILKMLELSAAINGRNVVNELDMLFVEDLFMHTCEFFEPEQLVRHGFWEEPIAISEVRQLLQIVKAPKSVHKNTSTPVSEFIRSRCERYDLFGEGKVHWDRLTRNIIYDLESEFNMSLVEARSRFDTYVQQHVPDAREPLPPWAAEAMDVAHDIIAQRTLELPADPSVEVLTVPLKVRRAPFQMPPDEMDTAGVADYLMREFLESKYISKHELNDACIAYELNGQLVGKILEDFRNQKYIVLTGDGYRWSQ